MMLEKLLRESAQISCVRMNAFTFAYAFEDSKREFVLNIHISIVDVLIN